MEEVQCDKCLCRSYCAVQSQNQGVRDTPKWRVQSELVEEQHQTTTFDDQVIAPTIAPATRYSDLDVSDPTTSSELGDFLKRPVRIYSSTWTTAEGTGVRDEIDPWYLYLNNANIKYKLNNYGYIRGNLHVKVVINASPFYYGACLVNYTPMSAYHGRTAEVTNAMFYIPESQKPSFMIYPQESKGGDLILPFYYNANYLRLTSAADITAMGKMALVVYSPLRSANGAVGTGCSIQMYAWLEDPVLAGPTVGLAVQSRDEYGSGPISGPASAAAKFAATLKKVPYIGRFATATEIGAKAISGMAQIFGFTNVPVIEPARPVTMLAGPQLASAQIGHVVQKLAFDPKTELTVDNGAIGFTNTDELTIASMTQRKSFLCKTTWTSAQAIDTNLFNVLVSPNMFDSVPLTGQTRIAMTPLDMVQRMFRNWRGDVIFTFRVVASKYHKGRLRLSYDPVDQTIVSTGDVGAVVQNLIYDLGHEEEEVEFRVPYSAATSWLRSGTNITTKGWNVDGTPLIRNRLYDNGVLTLKVLTLLTSPVATSSVDILIFVRAADNFEVANPCSIEGNFSQFAVQSQDERTPTPMAIKEDGGDCSAIVSERNRIYMGEQVRTLRHLLRRYTFMDRTYGTTGVVGNLKATMSRYPVHWGYTSNGLHTARNRAGTLDVPFNWVQTVPYHFISQCFLGQRGAIHWTVSGVTGSYVPFKLRRQTAGAITSADVMPWSVTASSLTYSGSVIRGQWTRSDDAAGCAVANMGNSNSLNVSAPDYSTHKFHSTAALMGNAWGTDPASVNDALEFEYPAVLNATSMNFDRYFSVGTDFNLVNFMYVPLWYVYDTTPAAAAV